MEVSGKYNQPLIASLIAGLQQIQLQPTGDEVADALWLALRMRETNTQEQETLLPAIVETSQSPGSDEHKPSENEESRPFEDGDLDSIWNTHPVYPRSTDSGIPIKIAAASALPGARDIERALRPFMRRIRSRTEFAFDEVATAQWIAETQIWRVILQPVLERWFEVALVVDESASMVIWRQTIAELRTLLERLGAFRDLRVWGLATDAHDKQVPLYAGTDPALGPRRPRHPSELIDPTGRRLILVVSDCVASAWHDGRMSKLLATWEHSNLVTIVQLLSQRLWPGTALGAASEVWLQAPVPGAPNSRLRIDDTELLFNEYTENSLKIPIVTLEAESLAPWARMVTEAGDAWVSGFLLDRSPMVAHTHNSQEDGTERQESSDTALSARERLQHFEASATLMAYKLAVYLAAVPLTLPVMRLVQRTMLPESRQIHLAEVFLSGLLKQVSKANHPDDIQYDFVDGVRDLLLNEVLLHEATDVLKTVSDYIARRARQSFDFLALIADPSNPGGIAIAQHSRPFATIATQVLERFGGRYLQVARQLEKGLEESDSEESTVETTTASAVHDQSQANERLRHLGFQYDPFAWLQAEKVPEEIWEELFISPVGFEEHLKDLDSSTALLAPRGGGKTANRLYLARYLNERREQNLKYEEGKESWPYTPLVVTYADFQNVVKPGSKVPLKDHEEPLLTAVAKAVCDFITKHPFNFMMLEKRKRDRWWSFLHMYLVPELDCLENDLLAKDFKSKADRDAPFSTNRPTATKLNRVRQMCSDMGIDSLFILVDQVDTHYQNQKELEAVLWSLLNTQQLYERVVWKFFLPNTLADLVTGSYTFQTLRLKRVDLKWDAFSLRQLLQQRLSWASNGAISSINQLCKQSLLHTVEFEKELIQMTLNETNIGPPRALLYQANKLFSAHKEEMANMLISSTDWNRFKEEVAKKQIYQYSKPSVK